MDSHEPRPTFPPSGSSKRYSSSADLYSMPDSPLVSPQQLPTNTVDYEEEPSSWRTSYADFKPHRGSARYSQAASTLMSSPSYNHLDLVEAPMLSKEDWTKGEPTRQYHAKGDARKQSARQVAQSTKGWLGKRIKWIAGGVMALILILAVVLPLVIPRFPSVDFASDSPFIETDTEPYLSSAAGNFSFVSDLHVEINAEDSFVPVRFSTFHVELKMLETNVLVAQGPRTGLGPVKGKKKTVYAIPLKWAGSFGNSTDPTFAAIASACAHKYDTVVRDTLNLTMTVQESVVGRIGDYTTSRVVVRDVECPVQFSSSAN